MSGTSVKKKMSTKERILSATEELVAESGFDGVSLRDITNGAGVNVAAVNYHFGSKENLYEAVQCRYLLPMNDERLVLLDKVMECDGGVREIVEAFVRPMLTMVSESKMSEELFAKLVGQCVMDKNLNMSGEMMLSFKRVLGMFLKALSGVLPALKTDELIWRLHFSVGIVHHTLLYGDILKELTEGVSGETSFEKTFQRIVDFSCAGFLSETLEEGAKA